MIDLSILFLPDVIEDAEEFVFVVCTVLANNVKIDDEVNDWLIQKKHEGRFRSLNAALRFELGLDKKRLEGSFVKFYADKKLNKGVILEDFRESRK